MERITKIISIAVFFALIFCLPILTIALPKQEKSEIENRTLAEFPEFSIENYFDRTIMTGIDSYVSDHLAMRTNWMSAKATLELIAGKTEINDVYVIDNRFVEKLEEPDQTVVDKSIDAINHFAEVTGIPTFVMLAPTSGGIYYESLPKFAPQYDQKEFIDNVYYALDDSITTLDAFSPLYSTRDEYIFYRTDHHWTSLGAYYTYASTIKKMGFSPVSYDNFDVEHASDSFRGTFYSKVILNNIKPDIIDYYHNKKGTQITSYEVFEYDGVKTYDSIYFRDYLSVKDKYSSFTGSNQAKTVIHTDADNDEKLLLIKDSYAHTYVQFLAQHYSEITMIDLRYLTPGALPLIVDMEEIDQALFLYNASTFSTDENIKALSLMKSTT